MDNKNWKDSWKDNWKGNFQNQQDGFVFENEFNEPESKKKLRELHEARDRGNPIASWKLRQIRGIKGLLVILPIIIIILIARSCGG